MKKILLIEPCDDCRDFIKSTLQEYAHIRQKDFSIDETTSGSEAVMLCSLEEYDLIYVNVDLSEISGIKATKLMRAHNPNSLIIALSKEGVEAHKKILFAGADDYMLQPIRSELFKARLDIYLSLIKSRQHEKSNSFGHNLYKDTIYSRTTSFFIKNQDTLAEFWEYYVLEEMKGYGTVSNTIMALYDISAQMLKQSLYPYIWVEESDKNIYFTINESYKVDSALLQKIISRNLQVSNHIVGKNKISFQCTRQDDSTSNIKATKIFVETESQNKSKSTPIQTTNKIKQLQVYDYMDKEHLENIEEYIKRLSSLLLLVGNDVEIEEVEEIAFFLDKIGKSTFLYSESYSISRALSDLSSTIKKNTQEFISKSSSLGELCSSFGLDLTSWVQMIFYDGAPSVNFMDDTIVSNSKMLESMLQDQANEDDSASLDDIFDF